MTTADQQQVYASFADKLEAYATQRQSVNRMLEENRPQSVLFAGHEQEVLATMRKPNSVKEWNELIATMMCHNDLGVITEQGSKGKRRTNKKAEDALKREQNLSDLTTLLRLRNRRIRPQAPGAFRHWATVNAELLLRCQSYLERWQAGTTQGSKIAAEICIIVEQLDFNEGEAARIEALDLLNHEELNTSWQSFCMQQKHGGSRKPNQNKNTARFGNTRPTSGSAAVTQERMKMKQRALKTAKEKTQRLSEKLIQLEKNFRNVTTISKPAVVEQMQQDPSASSCQVQEIQIMQQNAFIGQDEFELFEAAELTPQQQYDQNEM